jgi:hypothetical protein
VALVLFGVIFFCWTLVWLLTGYPIWVMVLAGFLGYAIYGALTFCVAQQQAKWK